MKNEQALARVKANESRILQQKQEIEMQMMNVSPTKILIEDLLTSDLLFLLNFRSRRKTSADARWNASVRLPRSRNWQSRDKHRFKAL